MFIPAIQVAGGTDFVRKTLDAFTPPTVSTTVLCDLLGYDAFPALASLEDFLGMIRAHLLTTWCVATELKCEKNAQSTSTN